MSSGWCRILSLMFIVSLPTGCSGSRDGNGPDVPIASSPEGTTANRCPPLPPLASIPKGFPNITLPSDALVIKPAAKPADGMRIDFVIPNSGVDDVRAFFTESLATDGYEVVGADFEGFEAEVYFGKKGTSLTGFVHILITCDEDMTLASLQLYR